MVPTGTGDLQHISFATSKYVYSSVFNFVPEIPCNIHECIIFDYLVGESENQRA